MAKDRGQRTPEDRPVNSVRYGSVSVEVKVAETIIYQVLKLALALKLNYVAKFIMSKDRALVHIGEGKKRLTVTTGSIREEFNQALGHD